MKAPSTPLRTHPTPRARRHVLPAGRHVEEADGDELVAGVVTRDLRLVVVVAAPADHRAWGQGGCQWVLDSWTIPKIVNLITRENLLEELIKSLYNLLSSITR